MSKFFPAFADLSSMPRVCLSYRLFIFVAWCTIFLVILSFKEAINQKSSNYMFVDDILVYELNSNETRSEKLDHVLPNLPMEFWLKNRNNIGNLKKNSSCAPFPKLLELEYSNIYWQGFKANDTSFQLYNAFYDTRKINLLRNCVQIVAMLNQHNLTQEIYCQFWFENRTEPVIAGTTIFKYIWFKAWGIHKKGTYAAYIVTCQLPETEQSEAPVCVSLVENECDQATNLLKVHYDVPEVKEEFAVCVKGLDFFESDVSIKLVEWLEFLDMMGVHKVFMYELHAHPNIEKVLRFYTALGRVDVTQITLPGKQPNLPILQQEFLANNGGQRRWDELIPYNDCFYRNIYSYKYVAILDIDEIIVPILDKNWSELMERVLIESKSKNMTISSYNAKNVFFLDDMTPKDLNNNIPEYMHMVRHTYRSVNFTPPMFFVKSFIDPRYVLSVHNHLPLDYDEKSLKSYSMNLSHTQMNHYRRDCSNGVNCDIYKNHTVQDRTLLPFRDELIKRVSRIVRILNLN